MNLRLAHRLWERSARSGAATGLRLGFSCLAVGFVARAYGECGTPSGTTLALGVDERLNVNMQDGRIVRLAGLDAPDPTGVGAQNAEAARQFLADRLVGRNVQLNLLASGPDRWERVLADLSIPGTAGIEASSVAMALLAAGFARVRPEVETRSGAAARLAGEEGARRD